MNTLVKFWNFRTVFRAYERSIVPIVTVFRGMMTAPEAEISFPAFGRSVTSFLIWEDNDGGHVE